MRPIPIRAIAAIGIFVTAVLALQSGVILSAEDAGVSRSILVDCYYALSLFVIGGIDIGTPQSGPAWAVALLWLSYFAAPILAVSTVLDLFLRMFTQHRWRLRRLRNHVIIDGDDELTRSYLRHLRQIDPKRQVVVLQGAGFSDTSREQLRRSFGALTWEGDLIDAFTFDQLRVKHAAKILLFSNYSLKNYETVKAMLDRRQDLAGKIVMHVDRLRFMRSMSSSRIAQSVTVFNGYQSAAESLVTTLAVPHVRQSGVPMGVVIAGFGRFGQSVLESLQNALPDEIAAVALIEHDAERRVMVTREQFSISTNFELKILQGDMTHPGVWEDLDGFWDRNSPNTLFVFATHREEDNLRSALWLRRHNPNAWVFARISRYSSFAQEVADDHDIIAMGLSQLIERSFPQSWIDCSMEGTAELIPPGS
ncbi:NAD-binding protein [Congregibacter variabilis]|uniref:NAD-binding protein n=1 Tax=Congregibacter variabilis TaxID=3081200 RepID=A0ABZ0I8I2_9GAMM|nr:NAD-binding protein [Congregibacter sp. IMCC43200]